MAAVLAGGPLAVLSHRSAAALWGLIAYHGLPEVTVPGTGRRRPRLTFHHSPLPSDERTVHDAIPVTTVARTLIDLAALVPDHQLERAVNEAEIRGLTGPLSLGELVERHPRRPGTKLLRVQLDRLNAGATVTRSDLESLFLAFLDDIGLPRPATNVAVEGLEVDCVWRRERVAVELDSRGFTTTRSPTSVIESATATFTRWTGARCASHGDN